VSGPPAEPATASPASRRHASRRSLLPSVSLVAAAGAPLRCSHVKPAAAYTKDVGQTKTQTSAGKFRHPIAAASVATWIQKAILRRNIT
jgi:hypothetical protein